MNTELYTKLRTLLEMIGEDGKYVLHRRDGREVDLFDAVEINTALKELRVELEGINNGYVRTQKVH